jgi:hypothetical protein
MHRVKERGRSAQQTNKREKRKGEREKEGKKEQKVTRGNRKYTGAVNTRPLLLIYFHTSS